MHTHIFGHHIITYLEDCHLTRFCPVTMEHLVGPSTWLNSSAQSPRNTLHRLGCPLKEVLLIEKASILGVLGVRGGQRLLYQTPLDRALNSQPDPRVTPTNWVPSCPYIRTVLEDPDWAGCASQYPPCWLFYGKTHKFALDMWPLAKNFISQPPLQRGTASWPSFGQWGHDHHYQGIQTNLVSGLCIENQSQKKKKERNGWINVFMCDIKIHKH